LVDHTLDQPFIGRSHVGPVPKTDDGSLVKQILGCAKVKLTKAMERGTLLEELVNKPYILCTAFTDAYIVFTITNNVYCLGF